MYTHIFTGLGGKPRINFTLGSTILREISNKIILEFFFRFFFQFIPAGFFQFIHYLLLNFYRYHSYKSGLWETMAMILQNKYSFYKTLKNEKSGNIVTTSVFLALLVTTPFLSSLERIFADSMIFS